LEDSLTLTISTICTEKEKETKWHTKDGIKLTEDDLGGLVGLALSESLADAGNNLESVGQGEASLLGNQLGEKRAQANE
jgi:hypothetical protein